MSTGKLNVTTTCLLASGYTSSPEGVTETNWRGSVRNVNCRVAGERFTLQRMQGGAHAERVLGGRGELALWLEGAGAGNRTSGRCPRRAARWQGSWNEVAGLSSVFRAMTGLLKRTQTPPSRFSWGTVPEGPTSATAKSVVRRVAAARCQGRKDRRHLHAGRRRNGVPCSRRPEHAARTSRQTGSETGQEQFFSSVPPSRSRNSSAFSRLISTKDAPGAQARVDKARVFGHISPRTVGVVQLAEHQTVDLEVVGSRPITHPSAAQAREAGGDAKRRESPGEGTAG